MDRDRVLPRNFPAGHMMYVHQPTMGELARDVNAFVAARPVRSQD
jgi:carboxypeptidase C (cathepsin A)